MKLLFAILLILASLAPAHAQPSLYVFGWTSPLPVEIERIQVTGGSLVQVLTSGDGLSGTIAVSAERECLTVTVDGVTTTGAGVRWVRARDAECVRVWLPFIQHAPGEQGQGLRDQAVGAWATPQLGSVPHVPPGST